MIIKGEGIKLWLGVDGCGMVVKFVVQHQDVRLRSESKKTGFISLAKFRGWELISSANPAIWPISRYVYVRGRCQGADDGVAETEFKDKRDARACVAAIKGLVKQVKLRR